jgi:hypothetical protein
MSSLDRWRTTGTPGHLSRRTPSNPKYDGVTSRLNTGMTVAKLNKRYAGTGGPNAHRRPTNQYFAKLKPTTLAKLVEPKMEAEESIYKVEKDDAVSTVTTMVDAMQMSDDAIKNAEVMILDCRPFEDYHACRVHGAYHYDIAQLGKATNQFPRELYFFKAPIESNKMIVIYDSGRDVEATQRLGNAFVEKVRAAAAALAQFAPARSAHGPSLSLPQGVRAAATQAAPPLPPPPAAPVPTARNPAAATRRSARCHCPPRPRPPPALPPQGIDNTYVVHGGFHGIATRVPHILAGDVPPPYGIPGAEVLRLGSARPGSSRPTLGVLATGNSPRRPSSAGGCSTGTRDTDFSRFSNAIGASRTQLTAIGELKPWK